nr:divergent polysaccharide deacetylase family protein [Aliamphritea spongicola]
MGDAGGEETADVFIDSLTTSDTVAWKAARRADIPWLIRDIFLDHEQTPEFVERQFNAGVALARERGFAVLIGHPYPVTINFYRKPYPVWESWVFSWLLRAVSCYRCRTVRIWSVPGSISVKLKSAVLRGITSNCRNLFSVR